jgi:hypothetical protein
MDTPIYEQVKRKMRRSRVLDELVPVAVSAVLLVFVLLALVAS